MKHLKKILALSLALLMVFSLAACGDKGGAETNPPSGTNTEQPSGTNTEQPSGGGTTVDYPKSPITMIVNYSAGGGTDLAARALANAAATILGVPITPSNVTGGNGSVGVTELSNSKGDGYTIGVATLSPLALVPWQLEVTYTPDDFKYICAFGQYGYGIVVAADSPYQTVEDLIADAKTKTINYGATGYPQPFAMEDLAGMTGASFNFVTYPSTTDMITDVLGGFIPVVMADMASFAAYVRSGEMRLLASATTNRWPAAPDVQTLIEMGYDTSINSYLGLCVPDDTPDEIVEILRDAFAKAWEDATFVEIMNNANQGLAYMTGEEYEKLVREMYSEWGDRMEAAN